MANFLSLNGFLQRNVLLSLLWMFVTIGIYSFAPIINITLIKYFNINEQELSLISTSLIIGFIGANYLNSYFMNNHVNIVKILLYSLIVFLISISVEFYLFTNTKIDLNILILFRLLDGLSSYLFMTTIGHIISTKILKNKIRIKITSLMSTSNYIIKTLIPFFISGLIVFTQKPSILFLLAILCTIITIYLLIVYRRYIYFKYTRILLTITGTKKRNTKEEIKKYIDTTNLKEYIKRIYYLFMVINHNLLRSSYDLILPVMLIINYKLTLIESTFLISIMVVGQAMQFLTSFILKKINLIYFNYIHLVLHLSVLVILFKFEINNMMILSIIFLLLGISRSMYAIWDYEYGMRLINKEITIQNHNFISKTIGELGHLISYVAVTALVLTKGDYTNIGIYYIILPVFMIMYSLCMDKEVIFKKKS